jgi:hypothetical protein
LLSRGGAVEGAWVMGRWGGRGCESEEMGPRKEIFGVFGWVERRKVSQPIGFSIGFSSEGTIRKSSAVPLFFWQRSVGL